jgi:hypothetical protein
MLEVGLEQKILSASQLAVHVTPEVLAHHLPPDVMTRVIAAALAAGQRGEQTTPDRLFEALSPDVLVENVPLDVLWRSVDSAAERSGIADRVAGEGIRS